MDNTTNQIMDNRTLKKQLAVLLTGSGEAYENYKRAQQIKAHYPNDLHYYNDTFYIRHDRNIEEINKIKVLINQGVLKPEMLLNNTWNAFYPSYVMNHHFSIYLQIVSLLAKQIQNGDLMKILSKANKMEELGCFCQKIKSTEFGKSVNDYEPKLKKNGEIEMSEDYYFFDKHISLYYHVACFIAQIQEEKVLVFVKLRDDKGNLQKQVNVKDFGERMSPEYLQVGYNFNRVRPFFVIKGKHLFNEVANDMKFRLINNIGYFNQFNLSLLDLKKSLNLTIKYTKMRTQFKTLSDSKEERPIISYQAVGSRIIQAFSKLVCFSELNKALSNNKQIIPLASPLLDINHHLILQSVIRLRQCCGGFGYLQVAGHASSIQKLTLRASESFIAEVPENIQILKRLHYYSSSDAMEQYFGDQLTKQNAFKGSQVFSVFINVCVNMRKSSQSMRKQIYLRHFMYQAAIQVLKTSEQFSKIDRESVWFYALHYTCASYILENQEFINWKYIDQHLPKQEYFRGLTEFKNIYLNKLTSQMSVIEEILEVDHLRNVVVGRQCSNDFYNEVLETSKNNLRNSEQFVEYVKRPLTELLISNNAKL